MAQMDAFALKAAEKVFGHGVVIGVALAGHALPDAEGGQALLVSVGGVLDAAVGVKDETGLRPAALDSHIQGGQGKTGVNMVGEGVANDLLCAKVLHDSAVEPALAGRDIGDVADPCGVGLVKGEAAREEIRRDGMRMSGVCSGFVSALACGGNAQLIHQAVDALAGAGKLRADQMIQAVQPKGRITLVQAQQFALERLVLLSTQGGLAAQPFVVPAAGDLQQPAYNLHRSSRAGGVDVLVLVLYGLESMPTDFFKTSMTPSFSSSFLRSARFSASSSRRRLASRF